MNYQDPFEIIIPFEIGRYITPYGIGFDLGPNGFTYVYDVTDYQSMLTGDVDFSAHNTQELIDVKFVFIQEHRQEMFYLLTNYGMDCKVILTQVWIMI
ncbi:MAG: hypothetical protein IPM77_18730 [Crocinitomicaceae bacterium]|nr:hypothetical protein [Crocinitomicaceae bacterium]